MNGRRLCKGFQGPVEIDGFAEAQRQTRAPALRTGTAHRIATWPGPCVQGVNMLPDGCIHLLAAPDATISSSCYAAAASTRTAELLAALNIPLKAMLSIPSRNSQISVVTVKCCLACWALTPEPFHSTARCTVRPERRFWRARACPAPAAPHGTGDL